jgi:hypothetical protein
MLNYAMLTDQLMPLFHMLVNVTNITPDFFFAGQQQEHYIGPLAFTNGIFPQVFGNGPFNK